MRALLGYRTTGSSQRANCGVISRRPFSFRLVPVESPADKKQEYLIEKPDGRRLAFVVSHPSRDETARWMGHTPFWGEFDASHAFRMLWVGNTRGGLIRNRNI